VPLRDVLRMSYPQHMQHPAVVSVGRPGPAGHPKPVRDKAMVSERQFGIRLAQIAGEDAKKCRLPRNRRFT
jgi:hypothetical protein